MDDPNQPIENPTENSTENPGPQNFSPKFLAVAGSKWLVVGLALVVSLALYTVSARSRGLWPFPASEVKVAATLSPSPTFNIVPNPMADSSTELTAGWQTYQNAEYGFEFKYPERFIEKESTDSTKSEAGFYQNEKTFSAGLPPAFNFSIDTLSATKSLVERIKSFAPDSIAEITIGSNKYTKWLESTGEGMTTTNLSILFNSNKVTTFSALGGFASEPNFNQILSTFKFIPSTGSGQVQPTLTPADSGTACIEVVTKALNFQTGEIKYFPTPCDVPEGWSRLSPNP